MAKAIDTTAGHLWFGYGRQDGTGDRVLIGGDSPEAVRAKALGQPYAVNLWMIWRDE